MFISVPAFPEAESPRSGSSLFITKCQFCHDAGGRATRLSGLGMLPPEMVYKAITTGAMKSKAEGLSEAERHALVDYIAATGKHQEDHLAACPAGETLKGESVWNGWSRDPHNARFQPRPGLAAAQVPSLKLRWALVFPAVATAANQATVIDGKLYIGSWDGTVYALNARTGCAYWKFQADAAVRSAVSVADGVATFGDLHSAAYGLDAATGKVLWKTVVEDHPVSRITGSLAVYDGRVYVPVSSLEEAAAGDPKYACCTFRGSVVALDLKTGKQLWKTHTIEPAPHKVGKTAIGTDKMGPSGGAIWSPPTIDEKRGLVYVATGNAYSEPESGGSDAVMAFDLKTGARRWSHQLLPGDFSNVACYSGFTRGQRDNCPDKEGPDYDFGAPPVLVTMSDGRDILLAGQKSGEAYALDPDKDGALIWKTKVGPGGLVGGIEFGMATDGERVFVANAGWEWKDPHAKSSVSALDLRTGKILWQTPNWNDICEERRRGCATAIVAPVTLIPGAVFVGAISGHLRAYDADTGNVLWVNDTEAAFDGINGIKGHGGSINGAGATVADGFVYQTSGYSAFALGMDGNVLLVFGADK